ncbi:MAG: hypothetical protein IKV97_06110 [Clostridia bacterium]|nr:hypothetical protein [Clostridia bacterium]
MAEKDICAKICEELNALSEEPCGEIATHISECAECAEHYKKLCEMRKLLMKSAPVVPELRSAVIGRIRSENVSVSPVYRRRRIPFGTVAAAAAILAVFAVSYGVKTPDGIFSQSKNSAENDCAPMVETQMFSATSGTDGIFSDKAGNAESSKITYFATSYSSDNALESTEEEIAEAETESAPEEKIAEPETTSANERDGSEAADGKPKLLCALPPAKDRAESDIATEYKPDYTEGPENDSGEKPDGTQFTVADNINAPILAENGENTVEEPKGTEHSNMSDAIEDGFRGSSGGGGGGSSAAQQDTSEGGSALEMAKDIYEVMKIVYPDRISLEVFESVGAETYLAFIENIEEPDTDYTEQALLAFAESYAAHN